MLHFQTNLSLKKITSPEKHICADYGNMARLENQPLYYKIYSDHWSYREIKKKKNPWNIHSSFSINILDIYIIIHIASQLDTCIEGITWIWLL